MARMLSLSHSPADGLEDFRAAQLGDEKTESIAAGRCVTAHIAAGSGSPLDYTGQLKLSQGAVDGGPGRPKALDKFRLARKALSGLILTGCYCIRETLTNPLVFRKGNLAWHNLIIQVVR